MDDFQYELKVTAYKNITTKKAKTKFIRDLLEDYSYIFSADYNAVRLLLTIYNDTDILKPSVLRAINNTAHSFYDKLDTTLLPITAVTDTRTLDDLTYSTGVPAYLKIAVIKAMREQYTLTQIQAQGARITTT